MLPDLQHRGKVLYGCYNRATSKVLSSCTFNFKLLNFSGECKHTKLIDDPWQKVLKFCWPKATPRGNKSGANSLNSESHKNAQRLHQVVWTRYKPHTKPVQQKKHIFFQKNYTLDLLFVCEAPVTTHVLAAIEAWTLGFTKWMTVSSLKMFTSSMPGIVLTPSLFKVLCNLLSSVVVVLCTAFFFLLTLPLPPVLTALAIFMSFSLFMVAAMALHKTRSRTDTLTKGEKGNEGDRPCLGLLSPAPFRPGHPLFYP
jgi:hypothetical protein